MTGVAFLGLSFVLYRSLPVLVRGHALLLGLFEIPLAIAEARFDSGPLWRFSLATYVIIAGGTLLVIGNAAYVDRLYGPSGADLWSLEIFRERAALALAAIVVPYTCAYYARRCRRLILPAAACSACLVLVAVPAPLSSRVGIVFGLAVIYSLPMLYSTMRNWGIKFY